jgi:hypothetical protein
LFVAPFSFLRVRAWRLIPHVLPTLVATCARDTMRSRSRNLVFRGWHGVVWNVLGGWVAQLVEADAKLAASAPQQILWNAIRKDVIAIIEDEKSLNPGVDGYPGNTGGGGDVGPMLVRLAWHCAGSYDKASGTGGSNGATMRFKPESDHGGNAGLGHARALLEPIKAKCVISQPPPDT